MLDPDRHPDPVALWAVRLPLVAGLVYLELTPDPRRPGRTRWAAYTSRLGLLARGRSGDA